MECRKRAFDELALNVISLLGILACCA